MRRLRQILAWVPLDLRARIVGACCVVLGHVIAMGLVLERIDHILVGGGVLMVTLLLIRLVVGGVTDQHLVHLLVVLEQLVFIEGGPG